ncbi:MAG: glycosyltransferase, partial [Anaerolineae bacterium]|nr:glycosyltransferase [Anaerolineae bacterium]
ENRPNAVLEAMALAVPCIVTDVGDSWLMSGGDNLPPASLCVPVEDADALAQAMQRLMEDKGLRQRLSGAGLERAALFQPDSILPRIETLYRAVIHD